MAKRGRQSVASLAIAGPVTVSQRLAPPLALTPAQKAEWVVVVNSRPADWFRPEHIGMLTQYVRHKVLADTIAQQLDNFDPAWLVVDEEDEDDNGETAKMGLRRYDKLAAMLERETRTINALLRSMRLTQQSQIRADKVVESTKTRLPWLPEDQ